MGRTGRGRITLAWPGVVLALALVFAACSSGDAPARSSVEDRLLRPADFSADFPADFSADAVSESDLESTVTLLGQPTAQLRLSGPDFTMVQSIVRFASKSEALYVLAGIKADQTSQSVTPYDSSNLEDVSGILSEIRGGSESLTIFFVAGEDLVRLTVTGPRRLELLQTYAEKAILKASK